MTTLVQLEGAARRFGSGHTEVTALHPTSLSVEAGELLAVMGPSGSGKTTLLSLVGGLDKPTEGHVIVAGQDVDQAALPARRAFLGLPTRQELLKALKLSAIVTALCLLAPGVVLAQALNVDLGTGAGLTERVVQLIGLAQSAGLSRIGFVRS